MKNTNSNPTMKDVAAEAGVSLGTVSNVFNNVPVGDEYRKRVEKAALKLNYKLNGSARALKTNQTNSVALLIPSIRHPFYAALTDEITASLMRRGYRNNLMITNFDPEAEKKSIELVQENKLDGIIGLTYNPDLVIENDIPFVTIDRHFSEKVPCVSSDNFGGGIIAAEKLLELGCKKLLYMSIGSDIYGEVAKRQSGFESVCRTRDIPHDSIVLSDKGTDEAFYVYLKKHIKKGSLSFDGIFCNTDNLALHIKAFLEEKHIKVPKDVQIIGYDGIPDYYTGAPVCSTIVQPIKDMAEAAVKIITENYSESPPALINIPVHYAPGGTTKD